MNKVALSAVVVSLAGFAIVSAGPGCNSSSDNGSSSSSSSSGGSSSSGSSSSGGSSSSSSSSGSTMDSGADGEGMDATEGSTGEGGVCPAPETGSASCNACVDTSCMMQWCTCAADTTVDDAGAPTGGCAAFVQCVSMCVGMDGGMSGPCLASCEAADGGGAQGGPYTSTDISDGVALLTCIQSMCTSAPDGGDAGAACQP